MSGTTVPLDNAKRSEIMSLQAISQVLPYKFAGGDARIDELTMTCSTCCKEIGPDHIKAEFTARGDMADLKGYGLCYDCKTVTPMVAKFSADGSCLLFNGSSWVKGQWGKGVVAVEPWRLHIIPFLIAAALFLAWLYFHFHSSQQHQEPPTPAEIGRGET